MLTRTLVCLDARNYDDALVILDYYEIKSIRLLTNNPLKVLAFESRGAPAVTQVPLVVHPLHPKVTAYLRTKRDRMGHGQLPPG